MDPLAASVVYVYCIGWIKFFQGMVYTVRGGLHMYAGDGLHKLQGMAYYFCCNDYAVYSVRFSSR